MEMKWQNDWSPPLNLAHINMNTLMAIYIALKNVSLEKDMSVPLFSDNTSVVCFSTAWSLTLWSWTLWFIIQFGRWFVFGSTPLKGSPECHCRCLIQINQLETGCSLDQDSFMWIQSYVINPEVDLLAVRTNHKSTIYVTSVPDPFASTVNMFNLDWNRWRHIQLFLPWKFFSVVLSKFVHFLGQVIFIAPFLLNKTQFLNLFQRSKNLLEISILKLSQVVKGMVSQSLTLQCLRCGPF